MSEEFDDDESEGEPCPYCAEPNHLPSDTRCIHNVAWTWDGQTEALGSATQLAEAWATLCNAVYEVEEDSPEDAQLQAQALTVPDGARLVHQRYARRQRQLLVRQRSRAVGGDGRAMRGLV